MPSSTGAVIVNGYNQLSRNGVNFVGAIVGKVDAHEFKISDSIISP